MTRYVGKCTTTAKVWKVIGGERIYPDVTLNAPITADAKQGEYLHLTTPVNGWSKAIWFSYREETTPPPPPPPDPESTITLTHTIEVYSDGSIRVDGSPNT